MTVSELGRRMGSREFTEWMERFEVRSEAATMPDAMAMLDRLGKR